MSPGTFERGGPDRTTRRHQDQRGTSDGDTSKAQCTICVDAFVVH
jgi:hypothetical protein